MRRRQFIVRLFQVALGWLFGGRALSAFSAFAERGIFDLGVPGDFPPGTVKNFILLETIIISDSEGIYALSGLCTHRGGILYQTEKNDALVCRRHHSRFDLEGKVVKGPAYEPLDWIRLEVDKKGHLLLYARFRGRRGKKIPHQ